MTTRDIAVVLLAMVVSDRPVDAVRAVQDCGDLPSAGPLKVALPEESIFPFVGSDGELTTHVPKTVLGAFVCVLDTLMTVNANEKRSRRVDISFDTFNFRWVLETSAAAVVYESPMALASAAIKLTPKGEEQVRAWNSLRKSYQNSKITVRRTLHFETLLEVVQAFGEA